MRISPGRLRNVLSHVERHLADPLKVADLARVACVSRYHFCRSFRAAMGISPYRYVTNLRIEAARRLLRESSEPIDQIARACGYHGVRQFTARFRQITGTSPGRFRRMSARTADGWLSDY
jgi:AraC family transcriptional regulator